MLISFYAFVLGISLTSAKMHHLVNFHALISTGTQIAAVLKDLRKFKQSVP